MCYEVGGTVISLSEVEHCILRRPLSLPRVWFANSNIPKWHVDDPRQRFALTQPEPRINFVLNYGSVGSYPTYLLVYSAQQLDEQLDEGCRVFLNHSVSVSIERREIVLPKVCS